MTQIIHLENILLSEDTLSIAIETIFSISNTLMAPLITTFMISATNDVFATGYDPFTKYTLEEIPEATTRNVFQDYFLEEQVPYPK